MLPLLMQNCPAQVSLCPLQDLYVGDIAVFKGEEGFVCHRFFCTAIFNGALFLKTKPDIVYNFDPPIRSDRFIGKVVSFKSGAFTIRIDNLFSRVIGLSLGCLLPIFTHLYLRFKRLINVL